MRDKILLMVTFLVIMMFFLCALNYDPNKGIKRELSYTNDTEAILIETIEASSGDVDI